MKKPTQYKLKQWLYSNRIKGLIIHYEMTGADSAETIWELITDNHKPKRVKADDMIDFVDINPNYNTVMRVTDEVREEVREYNEFTESNAKELEEYERLKTKFA